MSSETLLSPSNPPEHDANLPNAEQHIYTSDVGQQHGIMPPPSKTEERYASKASSIRENLPWSPTPTPELRASFRPSEDVHPATLSRSPSLGMTNNARHIFTTDIMIERLMSAASLHEISLRTGSTKKHHEAIQNYLASEFAMTVPISTIRLNLEKLVVQRKAAIAASDNSGKDLAFGNAEQAIDNWIDCVEQLTRGKGEANPAKETLAALQKERDEARDGLTKTQRRKRKRQASSTGSNASTPTNLDLLQENGEATDSSVATSRSTSLSRKRPPAADFFEASLSRFVEHQMKRDDNELAVVKLQLNNLSEKIDRIIKKLGVDN